jgi:hypothetical protein
MPSTIHEAVAPTFVLHDTQHGVPDAEHEQPPALRLDGALDAALLEAAFQQHRASWFAADLQPFADHIAALLGHERELSQRWGGLPGTDHPSRWDDAVDDTHRAQPQRRAAHRLAVWHLPMAWVMPLVRRRSRQLQVRLPLADTQAALLALVRAALPKGWERHRVTVRLEVETRVYWGARRALSGEWEACRTRGDGLSHDIELFTLQHGRALDGSLTDDDGAPMLSRRLTSGVGLLVALPVLSFERQRPIRNRMTDWWRAVWRQIGWVRKGDRDPTYVQRLDTDEPFWNARTGSQPLTEALWSKALRDGAMLRPASAAAARCLAGGPRHAQETHVLLVHGGLSSAHAAFGEMLAPAGQPGLWSGMPLLDQASTWRFEHDTFLPVRHNIDRLLRWFGSTVQADGAGGRVVLIAHSRGGNVVRFALPELGKRFGPAWQFSAITAGSPHTGTEVFSRIGRRWTGLSCVVGAVRRISQGLLDREQLAQMVILERGLAYQVPVGFHDVEPKSVERMAKGQPLPEGLWMWGSEWGVSAAKPIEHGLWDWFVEDIGGAEVNGDGLVARASAFGGRDHGADGTTHDASPVFHTQYFGHAQTREQMSQRLAQLLGLS